MSLRTSTDRGDRTRKAAASLCAALALAALPTAPALAGDGGVSLKTSDCTHHSSAKLSNGKAIPPCTAPRKVKKVIAAANHIAKGYGYCLGGGHSSWKSSCYDCSGSVSYALHGGGLLDSPMDSTQLERWGAQRKGHWITVYANSGHAFMTVAGLRFDTSDTRGAGPGWASTMGFERPSQYASRHKGRL